MIFGSGTLYQGILTQNSFSFFEYGVSTASLKLLGYSNIGVDNFYKSFYWYDEGINIFR